MIYSQFGGLLPLAMETNVQRVTNMKYQNILLNTSLTFPFKDRKRAMVPTVPQFQFLYSIHYGRDILGKF